eukprot:TRINITY_DN1733_c0_g1_i5.p1 TRINITY_DN1733_c0_g1~~TRINITY_DN1733_c0_g1_i5.p1  ORF type:complete len:660 (-),score=103.83 TRINITY_DN1733_c0_g1_i5:762-2564(-)
MISNAADISNLARVSFSNSSLPERDTRHMHASTYGARYYRESIPKYTFPKTSIPAKVAYQLVHDEITLDGLPEQNMASFVTTWMEPEGLKLINESLNKNLADVDQYPQTREIHQRCVSMLADIFNAPNARRRSSSAAPAEGAKEIEKGEAGDDDDDDVVYEPVSVGTSTIGSSEAFMLAGLALKFNWRNRMTKLGKPTDKPNLVLGHNAQVALEKFCRYFDVEPRFVDVTQDTNFILSPKKAMELIDENTIGVVAILGSTYTGAFEPVEELDRMLHELHEKKGWYVPIHVDAASGGFIAPFLFPDLKWDFRLEMVRSINVSGHKYGLAMPGIGWVLFKDRADLAEELVFHIAYLGGDMPTYSLNFSRNASSVIAQYYSFLRLGFEGYKDIMFTCQRNALLLEECLRRMDHWNIWSDASCSLPVVAFSLKWGKDGGDYDDYDVSHKLRQKNWIVPAYTMPPASQEITLLRIVVRESHSVDLIEHLVLDLEWACMELAKERAKLRHKFIEEGMKAARIADAKAKEEEAKLTEKFPHAAAAAGVGAASSGPNPSSSSSIMDDDGHGPSAPTLSRRGDERGPPAHDHLVDFGGDQAHGTYNKVC